MRALDLVVGVSAQTRWYAVYLSWKFRRNPRGRNWFRFVDWRPNRRQWRNTIAILKELIGKNHEESAWEILGERCGCWSCRLVNRQVLNLVSRQKVWPKYGLSNPRYSEECWIGLQNGLLCSQDYYSFLHLVETMIMIALSLLISNKHDKRILCYLSSDTRSKAFCQAQFI